MAELAGALEDGGPDAVGCLGFRHMRPCGINPHPTLSLEGRGCCLPQPRDISPMRIVRRPDRWRI